MYKGGRMNVQTACKKKTPKPVPLRAAFEDAIEDLLQVSILVGIMPIY